MQSNRMRTVRCNCRRRRGCLPGGGGVYPSMHWAGGMYPSMHWAEGVSAPVHAGTHPTPVNRFLDTPVKILPVRNYVADGKNPKYQECMFTGLAGSKERRGESNAVRSVRDDRRDL